MTVFHSQPLKKPRSWPSSWLHSQIRRRWGATEIPPSEMPTDVTHLRKHSIMNLKMVRKISHSSKTLYDTMEARIVNGVELWCLSCIMMFRWINKQLGIDKFWHSCFCSNILNEYQHNFIITVLTQHSMGEMSLVKFVTHRFSLVEALRSFCSVIFFQGFIFTLYLRYWKHEGPGISDY